jgi:hypothetical protein
MVTIDEFIDMHIGENQTMLINDLMGNWMNDIQFEWDNVKNYSDAEIYEWWIVDSFLQRKLNEREEPLLINNYGTWWGRQTTGQAISMDEVIQDIYKECCR